MSTPIFVVTGFLSTGKTTFLNSLLNGKKWETAKILLIQFESGEEEFQSVQKNCHVLSFSKKDLERNPDQIPDQIADSLKKEQFDEIWIEWNGMTPFGQLYSLLLAPSLRGFCKLRKVLHIIDGSSFEKILGRTGSALPEQIQNSDFLIVRNADTPHHFRKTEKLLREINPKADIFASNEYHDFFKKLYGKPGFPVGILVFPAVLAVLLHSVFGQMADAVKTPLNTIINLFSGIMLQAIPFLLIGVLLSSAIQILIPKEAMIRFFPKSVGMGILTAIFCGFCLPVCDCASIPIFRSLIEKGVPLPAAVTFLTAAPVINPVVILSTYYAFGGNVEIVLSRVCFGIIAAVLIGTIFTVLPPRGQILAGGSYDRITCSCGCSVLYDSAETKRGKAMLFLRHSQAEFLNVGKYLVIGALISSVLQSFGTKLFSPAQHGIAFVFSILFMMGIAFLLSLCSSSDAVIARSLANQLPMGAVMGFLIFGPMMDLKNVLMLSSSFTSRFISRLIGVTFIVCFTVVFVFAQLGGM